MNAALAVGLKALRLPTMLRMLGEAQEMALREGWSHEQYLGCLVDCELAGRQDRRVERYICESGLSREKTFAVFDTNLLPMKVRNEIPLLVEGTFARKAENILIFGLPGRGKTHLACAIGHELVRKQIRTYFTPARRLVETLLGAKQEHQLNRALVKLDRFDVVILDDIGYVQQSAEEMEVLFDFLAERYESRSVIVTSNLPLGEWDRIFRNPMTTMAAIDRLVHHAHILELTCDSYRAREAVMRKNGGGERETNTPQADKMSGKQAQKLVSSAPDL